MAEKKEKTQIEKKPKKAVGTRGRTFEGFVTKKFPHRVVVEFERIVKAPKYERFYKKKQKLHARIPEGMDISVGDLVKVQQCRPLSKIVHFVVTNLVKKAEEKEK